LSTNGDARRPAPPIAKGHRLDPNTMTSQQNKIKYENYLLFISKVLQLEVRLIITMIHKGIIVIHYY
jgi:hypothetical protein